MEHLPRYIMHDVSECLRIAFDVEMGNVPGSNENLIEVVRYKGNVDTNKIEVDENNEGGLIIWDEASSMENSMIGVTFTVSEGSNEYGQLDSESGYFWDCDIGAGDLVIEAESTYFEHIVYFVLAEKGELAAKK